MRRFWTIASLVLAAALLIGGIRLIMEASRSSGWQAAAPALSGVACLLTAAVLIGPRVTRVLLYPVTSLLSGVFYPASYYTAPPESLLLSLRLRIAEGRFPSAETQLKALFAAYPPDPGLYHVWALLEAAKGGDARRVTIEASRALSRARFATYQDLLRTYPAGAPHGHDSRLSEDVP